LSRIVKWQDWLNEYDLDIYHRPGKSYLMGIADGLSRMLTRYMTIPKAEDSERMALPATIEVDIYKELRDSKEYEDIVDFLTSRSVRLRGKGLRASQIKNVRWKAKRYQLSGTRLLYTERDR
jgi:hypothetical protein